MEGEDKEASMSHGNKRPPAACIVSVLALVALAPIATAESFVFNTHADNSGGSGLWRRRSKI